MNNEGKLILSLVRMLLIAYVVLTVVENYTTIELNKTEVKSVCEVRV